MKRLLGFALAAAMAVAAAGCGGNANEVKSKSSSGKEAASQLDEKELSISAYGGNFEEIYKDRIIPAFEKKYGVKVTYKGNTSVQTLAALNASKSATPLFDVAVVDDGPFFQGKADGLWAPLDPNVVTNLSNLHPNLLEPDHVGAVLGSWAIGLSYNTQVFKEKGWQPPTSWNDLLRPEFAGKVFTNDLNNSYGLIGLVMMAAANGGGVDNMEPGFAKLKELLPKMTIAASTAQVEQLLQRKEAWIGVWGSGRLYTLADKGVPLQFVYPKEGTPALASMVTAVNNAPHPKLAQLFVNFVLSEDIQSILAETQKYGPSNKNVKLSEATKAQVPSPEQIQKMIKLDHTKINKLRSEWSDRWMREVAK
ncbi:ABC transporter substrate-binding protein [Paenibacillus hamazuiensis]|uniref:ABC transporter substrate-binding protein n=1 Tax=Paenibacillus hamazuiensis TaxID=2936508 RepID=UPI00201060FF|nr:ABC transporter substrate-binding protein [Paenibacillus hamazuiensis]